MSPPAMGPLTFYGSCPLAPRPPRRFGYLALHVGQWESEPFCVLLRRGVPTGARNLAACWTSRNHSLLLCAALVPYSLGLGGSPVGSEPSRVEPQAKPPSFHSTGGFAVPECQKRLPESACTGFHRRGQGCRPPAFAGSRSAPGRLRHYGYVCPRGVPVPLLYREQVAA